MSAVPGIALWPTKRMIRVGETTAADWLASRDAEAHLKTLNTWLELHVAWHDCQPHSGADISNDGLSPCTITFTAVEAGSNCRQEHTRFLYCFNYKLFRESPWSFRPEKTDRKDQRFSVCYCVIGDCKMRVRSWLRLFRKLQGTTDENATRQNLVEPIYRKIRNIRDRNTALRK